MIEHTLVAPRLQQRREAARRKALRMVADRSIEWRTTVGPSGGFTRLGGQLITDDPGLLVALWELRRDVLITVHGAVVSLTLSGQARLAESGRAAR